MVFLVVALRAAVEHRWLVLCVFALLLSLTRPIVFPLALFTAVLALRSEPDGQGRRWEAGGLGAATFIGLSTFAWPATAGLLTGDPSTFFDSTGSWVRAGGLRGGWLAGMWALGVPEFAVLTVAIVTALAYLRWRRREEPGPPDRISLWASIYMLFVLATTTTSTSVFRHALLTLVPFGAFGPMAMTSMRRRTRFLLVLGLVLGQLFLQWLWVRNVLVVDDSPDLSWPP